MNAVNLHRDEEAAQGNRNMFLNKIADNTMDETFKKRRSFKKNKNEKDTCA